MKQTICLIIMCFVLVGTAFSQVKKSTKLQDVIDTHVETFKNNINSYDNVYVVVSFDKEIMKREDRVYLVLPHIHPQHLNRNDNNFLIEFVFYDDPKEGVKVRAINSRIVKQTNKKLKLINLMNGQNYTLY